MQDEIHTERAARQCAQAPDFFPQTCRRIKLCLEDTKPTGTTHRCNQLYTRQVGSHWGNHDRRIDAETLAEASSKHGTPLLRHPRTDCSILAVENGPNAPSGREDNWVQTVSGRFWFPYFRLYAPTAAYFDHSWPLPDIEKAR
jgi:hypothetical protein